MKEFKLLPGMKVCIKRTADKSKDFNKGVVGFVKKAYCGDNPMSVNLGLYGKIIGLQLFCGIPLFIMQGGRTCWHWPVSCIDKSKPVIDLDGKKVYIQKRKLVI